MNKENKHFTEKLIDLLTILLICSFYIFETYTWGRYVYIAIISLIIVSVVIQNKGKYPYSKHKFHLFIINLIIFTFFSSLWAIKMSEPIQKGVTLLQTALCAFVIYNYYVSKKTINPLLKCIIYSSYIISVYAIWFYGLDYILNQVQNEVRLDNSFSNINSLGMIAAVGIIIQFYDFFKTKKLKIEYFLCIPSIILIAGTQSRKAFIILLLGILMVVFFNIAKKSNIVFSVIKIFIAGAFLLILLQQASKSVLFLGAFDRMQSIFDLITGKGSLSDISPIRTNMILLGIEIFKKNPLLGIGMGCPHIISAERLNYDAYLHNNFVELLAGGGIIGFSIFYYIYVYLLSKLGAYRKITNQNSAICLILIFLLLITDYGNVSVYSKITYIYFVAFFIQIEILKREKLELNSNNYPAYKWRNENEYKKTN